MLEIKKKILILEDDAILSLVLKKSLEKLGYTAFVSHDSKQALDIFSQQNSIDLFLFDLIIDGGESGLDILSSLRQKKPELKAVVSTGNLLPSCTTMHHLQGILIKPYTIQELDQTLKNVFSETSHQPFLNSF